MAHKKQFSLTKHGLIILLLWFAAPIAWYMMWKDKRYHSWFPHLMWINGLVFTTITFVQMPNIVNSSFFNPSVILAILIFALVQVVAGFFLQIKAHKSIKIVHNLIVPMISVFTLDIVIGYLYLVL